MIKSDKQLSPYIGFLGHFWTMLPYLVVAFLRKNNILLVMTDKRPTDIESPPYPQKAIYGCFPFAAQS